LGALAAILSRCCEPATPRAPPRLSPRIGFFYDVEREAKAIAEEQKLDGDQADALRLKMRQERTLPKLKEFKLWIDEQAKVVLPKSSIAQAIAYARAIGKLCFASPSTGS